jgi:hypothetical protein
LGSIRERIIDIDDRLVDQGCAAMKRTLEADNGDNERIN